jgi:hypothetical protein
MSDSCGVQFIGTMGRIAAGMMRNQKDERMREMGGMETKKWARINNEIKDAEGSRKG